MDSKVKCVITGQSMTMGKDYFEKKCVEYGGVENLKQFYISRKAKQLLLRGYSVTEIRKILGVDSTDLEPETSSSVQIVVNHYKNLEPNRRLESNLNFSLQTSDDDVTRFIENIVKEKH